MNATIAIILIGTIIFSGCIIEEESDCWDWHLEGDNPVGVVKDFRTDFAESKGWYCTVTFENGAKKQYEGQLCTILETEKMLVDDGYHCGLGHNTYKMVSQSGLRR